MKIAMKNGWSQTRIIGAACLSALFLLAPATTAGIELITIGNAGNAADTISYSKNYGAVDYTYQIGKYEVSIAEMTESGVGSGDENWWNDGGLFNDNTETRNYGVTAPAVNVTWFEAAKFCNWLTSGNATNGAYQFDGAGELTGVNRAAALVAYGTVYALPTEDEWYKAAYFKHDASGYSLYANGSGTGPVASMESNYSTNKAFKVGVTAVEQNGTYDMMGNVFEWMESSSDGNLNNMWENRVQRGGSYDVGTNTYLRSSSRVNDASPDVDDPTIGFRVVVVTQAAPPSVPYTYTTNSDNTITITGYTGSGGAVVVPSNIAGKTVTVVGISAFQDCTSLTSVTIPNSVTNILDSAFQSCESLTNGIIGNGVANLGDNAFSYCTSLKGLYFSGNAPVRGSYLFTGDNAATIYRLSSATGWPVVPNTWGTRPTAYWGAVSFLLTVNSGTGGGTCTNQQRVTIAATAVSGKTFDRWTGATLHVASITSSPTTVTMPASNIAVTATYKTAYYALTVIGGTGSGSCTNGQKVTIAATVPAGMKFASWNDGNTNVSRSITMTPAPISYTANFIDITKPAVAITLPTAALKVSNAVYAVRGTATDNKAVASVWVQVNSNGWTRAIGTNGWTNTVTLASGPNTIRAYSMDAANNCSATSSVICTYGVPGVLTIQTKGIGTVTRAPATAVEIGQTYTLTAAPGVGYGFVNWSGNVTGTNKVMTVKATSNTTVVANFADNVKPTVAITAPTALQKVYGTTGDFIVRGTAADNFALSNVMVKVNSGSFVPASPATTNGLKSWMLPVVLSTSLGGTNTIAAYSRDATGNCSLTVTTKCVYVETGTLNIITNGPGKVTVAPTGPLLLNKTYTLTAAANAGAVFSNWIGDASGTGKVALVTLTTSNRTKTVTANFIDTAKPTVVITYPANNAKVLTNGLVVIRGTAADNGVLKEIKYQLYSGVWTNAISTNVFKAWTANYVPVAGLNTSKVYSVDMQGNSSPTSTVVFTYIPGAILTVQTNTSAGGTITPSLNGKVLQIGSTNTMTAAPKAGYGFTNWTYGEGGVVTNGKVVKFVMTTNLVLTANFCKLPVCDAVAAPQTIVVDGSSKDWTDVPRCSFSYASTTQEVAVALDGNNIALLLNGCPFSTSDTLLVYFKLRLTYGEGDNRHTVDLWTSGSVLYGMVDGRMITGLEAVLLNGVLEIKFPVEQAPSQVTIEEVGCGMDLGGGTLMEVFKIISPPVSTQ